MARPRKQLGEKRDQRFNLRYTAAELAHIRAQAGKAGLDVHEYIRRKALSASVFAPIAARRSDPALVSELNRIGVNVNQLARATHRGGHFVGSWRDLQGELARVLKKIAGCDGPTPS